MTNAIITYLKTITGNNYLTLFLVSLCPMIESRGGVILMSGMEVNPWLGLLVCIAGSSLVVYPILLLLRPVLNLLAKRRLTASLSSKVEGVFQGKAESVKRILGKTKNPVDGNVMKDSSEAKDNDYAGEISIAYEKKRSLALYLFASVPLPLTGAWTSSGIAAIMRMPVLKAGALIILGNITSSLVLFALVSLFGKYADAILLGFLIVVLLSLGITAWRAIKKKEIENPAGKPNREKTK